MRRTIFMAFVAAVLLLVPSAAHAQSTQDILRDCADDGALEGDYSASAMRTARNNMPTELDEYSDCRDVLTRAITDKTSSGGGNSTNDSSSGGDASGGAGTGGTGGSGGGATGGDTGSTGSASPTPAATPGPGGVDSGREVPQTPQEWAAITEAQKGVDPNPADVKAVSPGERLNAEVGRNTLPGALVGVLALIAAAALALVATPLIRKRGLGPRQT